MKNTWKICALFFRWFINTIYVLLRHVFSPYHHPDNSLQITSLVYVRSNHYKVYTISAGIGGKTMRSDGIVLYNCHFWQSPYPTQNFESNKEIRLSFLKFEWVTPLLPLSTRSLVKFYSRTLHVVEVFFFY